MLADALGVGVVTTAAGLPDEGLAFGLAAAAWRG